MYHAGIRQSTSQVQFIFNQRSPRGKFNMNCVIVLALLVACTLSVNGQFGDGGHDHHHHLEEYVDYKAPPHYHWDYAVHDLKHHDIKSQWETRDHDQTKGMYTILQPDGRKRIVEYVAGKHGIDYKVKYEGHSEHGGIGALSG